MSIFEWSLKGLISRADRTSSYERRRNEEIAEIIAAGEMPLRDPLEAEIFNNPEDVTGEDLTPAPKKTLFGPLWEAFGPSDEEKEFVRKFEANPIEVSEGGIGVINGPSEESMYRLYSVVRIVFPQSATTEKPESSVKCFMKAKL